MMDPTRTSHDPATEDVASRTNMKKNRNENRGGQASMAPTLKKEVIVTTIEKSLTHSYDEIRLFLDAFSANRDFLQILLASFACNLY